MDEIIRRLRNRKNLNSLRESMPVQGLKEADEEEEDQETPEEESNEEVTPEETPEEETPEEELPDDGGSPSIGRGPSFSDEESGEESEETEEDPDPVDSIDDEGASREYTNPLDNPYAVKFNIGHQVALVYTDGSKTKARGVIEGYDSEGFYRIKWGNGMTTNGITDIALASIVEDTRESKCVCGGTKFVNENKKLVCDACGRLIERCTDPLSLADKNRPAGKKLIRSEAHTMSTAMNEERPVSKFSDSGYAVSYVYDGDKLSDYQSTIIVVAPSEEAAIKRAREEVPGRHFEIDVTVGHKGFISSVKDWKAAHPRSNYEIYETAAPKKSIEDSIRNAFKSKKLKEDISETRSINRLRKSLEGEFWTRLSELVDDIESLGYEVLDYNDEYVVISCEDEEGDNGELQVFLGGTARTITLDFDRTRFTVEMD